ARDTSDLFVLYLPVAGAQQLLDAARVRASAGGGGGVFPEGYCMRLALPEEMRLKAITLLQRDCWLLTVSDSASQPQQPNAGRESVYRLQAGLPTALRAALQGKSTDLFVDGKWAAYDFRTTPLASRV